MAFEAAREEVFLGFDARPAPSMMKKEWPLARRREALLRADVIAPLSVDYLIWPSAWPLDATDVGWRGPIQGLWDDEARLRSSLVGRPESWWVVAVVLEWGTVAPQDEADWLARTAELPRIPIEKIWKPLGYDVADRFLSTAMVWFRPGDEPKALRSTWGAYINKRHLFSGLQSATQFIPYANEHAPEHAPHCAYRLLLVGTA